MRVIAEFGRPPQPGRYHVEHWVAYTRAWCPVSRHRRGWTAVLAAWLDRVVIGTMTRVVDTGVVA